MSLTTMFPINFKKQMEGMGIPVHENGNTYVAADEERYISLEVIQEHYGTSKVTFAEVFILIGDYKKAIDKNITVVEPEGEIEHTENTFFDFRPSNSGQKYDAEILQELNDFKALKTVLYRCPEFIMLKQKGTHDLILKDPLVIQMLRGKKEVNTIIEKLSSLNIPHGWIIQKPKGLGKENVNQAWKLTGRIMSVLVPLTILFFIYLNSL